MDKAGAYGIQGGAGAFVEGLDGSFENVMGFPVDDVQRYALQTFSDEGTSGRRRWAFFHPAASAWTLGSANLTICLESEGVVLREPSYVLAARR